MIVVFIIQGCKMLHLLVVSDMSITHTSSSELVFVSIVLILSYLLPFLLHANTNTTTNINIKQQSQYQSKDNNKGSKDSNMQLSQEDGLWRPKIPNIISVAYILMTLYATSWAYQHSIIQNVLLFTTLHVPTTIQVIAAATSFWCIYMAIYMLIFYREYGAMRR